MNFTAPPLTLGTRLSMLARLMTLQGSYNYETMVGNGLAFAMEPALRMLPGGPSGDAYRAAMARQSRYFNAHPYLAAVAVGALARAELMLEDPERIERFRTASCGPLGSVGDRLVWAAWLPFCSLLALLAFGLGVSAGATVVGFLVVYNVGHLGLRAWGLSAGWNRGLAVASVLGNPLFRDGPAFIARAAAFAGGVAIPLVIAVAAGARPAGVLMIAAVAAIGATVLVLLEGRLAGWRAGTWVLVALALHAVLR
jgi:PTS system mannose-specific IID component